MPDDIGPRVSFETAPTTRERAEGLAVRHKNNVAPQLRRRR
ncbi:MAG TPA: hypothetical protein VK993_03985 [Chthoniobacterales bacterium]|nr:hypothetical protein [Chthoniobacterales bacterium]